MAGSLVPQVVWGLRPLERIPNRSFLLTRHPCSLGSTQVVKGDLNLPWDLILTTGTASLGCTLSLSDLSVEKSMPTSPLHGPISGCMWDRAEVSRSTA